LSELILSSTSVDNYLSCEYRWYLEYVEKTPGDQGVPAAVGLAVHAAVESYYRLRLAGADHAQILVHQMTGLVDELETTFMLNISGAPDDPGDPIDKARQQARRVLVSYLEDVGAKTNPRYAEQAVTVEINGIPYSMHIDLVDDEPTVWDLKVKRQKARDPSVYSFQINGGAIGFRFLTGEVEKDVGIMQMIRLKRDRPYPVPIRNGGPVTNAALSIFASTLQGVAEGIDRGDFRPTGLEKGICKWCRVRGSCDYYLADIIRENQNAPTTSS